MNTIIKPEDIKQWQLTMFMINTLSFQLEKWCEIPDDAPLLKQNKEAVKYLRNKCRKLIEINNVKPNSPTEEEFYEVGDEFHAIMGLIQKQNKVDSHLAFNMFEICVMIATDDFKGLEEFWQKLGVYISQMKVVRQ